MSKKLWLFELVQELVDIRYDRSNSYDLYVRVDAYELGTLFLLSNYITPVDL